MREPLANLQDLAHDIGNVGKGSGNTAVVAFSPQGREDWDRARLGRESKRFASSLRGSGLQTGDRVAILAPNQPAWFAVCLGAWRVGAAVVPLDVQLETKALRHILDDCGASLLVTTRDLADDLDGLDLGKRPGMVLLDADEGDEDHWQAGGNATDEGANQIAETDTAVIFYTSGTTGAPKGVPLSHANLVHQLNVLADSGLVRPDDRILLPLPLHHVYPFAIGMLLPLALGTPVVLPGLISGPQIVRALREGGVTGIIGVPRLFRSLYEGMQERVGSLGWMPRLCLRSLLRLCLFLRRRLGMRWGKWLLGALHRRMGPSVRVVASGGSPLDPKLAYRLESLGWQVAIGYGLTETSPLLTLNPPGSHCLDTVGKPIEGVELRIDSSSDRQPDSDEEQEWGEVLARGPNVFREYLNLPEQTEAAFTDEGWFRTGDRGRIDDAGRLHLGGRTSTMIVTESGENIQPDPLEQAYEGHPLIGEIGVLEKNGRLAAVVVPETSEMRGTDPDDIEATVGRAITEQGKSLPTYQRLSDFVVSSESLARTRLGKIRRHRLAERYDELAQGEGRPKADMQPIAVEDMSDRDQELLANSTARETWKWLAERFGDVRLTPDTDPSLELGIDSLDWIGLSLEIRERTGVELTESDISGIESVRDLLEAVTEGGSGSAGRDASEAMEEPEEQLDPDDTKWLTPYGAGLRALAWILHGFNRLVLRCYFRLTVEGLDNLPDEGPYILAPHHQSYLDAPAIAASLGVGRMRGLAWVGAAHIMRSNPVMRLIGRLTHVVPVDPRRAAVTSLALGALAIKRGKGLVLFPEGRMSERGDLRHLRPGAGMLADHFEIPVVPVWPKGTNQALPPGRFWPRPHRICVRFGKALDPRQLKTRGSKESGQKSITDALRRALLAVGERG